MKSNNSAVGHLKHPWRHARSEVLKSIAIISNWAGKAPFYPKAPESLWIQWVCFSLVLSFSVLILLIHFRSPSPSWVNISLFLLNTYYSFSFLLRPNIFPLQTFSSYSGLRKRVRVLYLVSWRVLGLIQEIFDLFFTLPLSTDLTLKWRKFGQPIEMRVTWARYW